MPWIIKPNIFSSELDTQFPNKMKKNYKTYIEKSSSCHGKKRNGINITKRDKLI